LILIREICEKQLANLNQNFDSKQERSDYIKLLIQICLSANKLINAASKIAFCVHNMSTEKYLQVTMLIAWNKFSNISQIAMKILELLKEDSLTIKFDISLFT
jgi:hypothetical protein